MAFPTDRRDLPAEPVNSPLDRGLDCYEPSSKHMSLRDRWQWFKLLRLHRCWTLGCWNRAGFHAVGTCDDCYAAVWNSPRVQEWLRNLKPVNIEQMS